MRELIRVLLISDEEKLQKFINSNHIMFSNVIHETAALVGVKEKVANMTSP